MQQEIDPQELCQQFKNQSCSILDKAFYNHMVPSERQEKEIQLLKETIHFDRFFFVLDLETFTISNAHGLYKWLGYPENNFDVLKFLKIIHPSHRLAHKITAKVLIEGLMRGHWKIEFMKHRFTSMIALQHIKGHYLLCKRLSCTFQYDEEHRLLEYLNEFTIIAEYKEEPYTISSYTNNGDKLNWLEEVVERARKAFEIDPDNLFAFQEIRILRKYAYIPSISMAEVANAFKITTNTVNEYNKRILTKAENLFYIHFKNSKEVAFFLKDQGLI